MTLKYIYIHISIHTVQTCMYHILVFVSFSNPHPFWPASSGLASATFSQQKPFRMCFSCKVGGAIRWLFCRSLTATGGGASLLGLRSIAVARAGCTTRMYISAAWLAAQVRCQRAIIYSV